MSLENKSDECSSGIDKNIHFTYKPQKDEKSLCQGDVLEITEELRTVLKETHPFFLDEQCRYLIVLSQSCDLVRRDGKNCKNPYIALAVVKNYNFFLEEMLLKNFCVERSQGLLLMDERKREKSLQLVERIYNNTEPDYFFLYKEEALGFEQSMVAYLKFSITIDSAAHYDKCINAKKIELADEFKAKIGWLIGNIYSRVGTADWDGIMSSESKENMFNDDLIKKCVIGDKDVLNKLKKELKKETQKPLSHEDAVNYLAKFPAKTKYEKVMDAIEETINTSSKKIPPEAKAQLLNAIKSRSILKTLIT